MLRATRDLLAPDRRAVFAAVHQAPGLDAGQREQLSDLGPSEMVTEEGDFADVVERAGFRALEFRDLTSAFRDTHRRWIDAAEQRADRLPDLPDVSTRERIDDHRRFQECLDAGLVARSLVVATR